MTDINSALNDAKAALATAATAITDAGTAVDAAIAAAANLAPVDPYALGTAYPKNAAVNILPTDVLPGATTINVPVQLDQDTPLTVVDWVHCYNGTGGLANPNINKLVIFRPGDPLIQTVPFDITRMNEGNSVNISQPNVPWGAVKGVDIYKPTAKADAVPVQPIVFQGRAQLDLTPLGNKVYEASGKEVFEGGLWLDRLAHGRFQPGNNESGRYMPTQGSAEWLADCQTLGVSTLPDTFTVDGDDLLLNSYTLPKPYMVGSTAYPMASSVLTCLMTDGTATKVRPDLVFQYGTIEFEVIVPKALYSWPALWLCSVSADGSPRWPFEIDIFEGFNSGLPWRSYDNISAAIHGGLEGVSSTFMRPSTPQGAIHASDFGLTPTLDSEKHKFACTVDHDFITMFLDGQETVQFRNPFNSTHGWYPIMNVAVRIPSGKVYDDANGAMRLGGVTLWRDS